jgi:hypothetical protein
MRLLNSVSPWNASAFTTGWRSLTDDRRRPTFEQPSRSSESSNASINLGATSQIDLHFAFMRVVLKALKLDADFQTPNVGFLSKYWHKCSELCHIAWPLSSGTVDSRQQAFLALTEVAQALAIQVRSLGWPILRDATFGALRDEFLAGKASEADVESHVRKRGLWARVEFTDGRPSEFAGEAVLPEKTSKPA